MKDRRLNRQSLTLAACIDRLTPLDDIMFKCMLTTGTEAQKLELMTEIGKILAHKARLSLGLPAQLKRQVEAGEEYLSAKDTWSWRITNAMRYQYLGLAIFPHGEAVVTLYGPGVPESVRAGVPAVLVFNARYRGTDAFGQLMHDFRTADPGQMTNPLMAQAAARAKSRKGGRGIMEGILQEYGQARELEGLRKGRRRGKKEGMREGLRQGHDEQVQVTLANLAREGITDPALMARIAGCSEQKALQTLKTIHSAA